MVLFSAPALPGCCLVRAPLISPAAGAWACVNILGGSACYTLGVLGPGPACYVLLSVYIVSYPNRVVKHFQTNYIIFGILDRQIFVYLCSMSSV